MRLIDADELKDGLYDGTVKNGGDLLMAMFNVVVDATPTVDAVTVVRCKDCMFYEPFREHDGFCRIDGMLWNESCYCSYGERKDGADDETL